MSTTTDCVALAVINPDTLAVSEAKTVCDPQIVTAVPTLDMLVKHAVKLWIAGAENRVALGLILIEIQNICAHHGNGTFLKALKEIGIKKSTAYDYIRQANGLPFSVRKKVEAKASTDVSSIELICNAEERKRMKKFRTENPKDFNRLLNEAVRVASVLGCKAAMAALGAASRYVGKTESEISQSFANAA